MTYDDWAEYWSPAAFRLITIDGEFLVEKLSQADRTISEVTGIPHPYVIDHDYPLTEDQKRVLKALAGPYGPTILRMLKARLDHGIECTTPDLE